MNITLQWIVVGLIGLAAVAWLLRYFGILQPLGLVMNGNRAGKPTSQKTACGGGGCKHCSATTPLDTDALEEHLHSAK